MLKSENNDFPIEYHIGLIDREANNELQMRFWETGQNTSVQNLNKRDRVKKDQSEFGGSKNYHISETFDYIKVFDNLNIRGMIIPKFKKTAPGAQRCSVSVDFGTTNTHIEYRYEEAIEKAFEVTDIFGSLTHSSDVKKGLNIVAERILTSELYPSEIGTEGICSFPLRSALLENGDTVQNNATQSFLDSNIAYYYERIGKTPHHTIKTDFKWGNMNDTVLKNRIQQFIEQLVEGIKNKLLLDNVSPRNMFITWLYPVSMTKFQRNSLALLWNEVIEKKIGSVIELRSMPESIAPFIFHVKNTGLVGLTASIDIGGGSSDISIYEEDKPQIISSIKFAGNAIVGDGYNNSVRNNGFVRTFGDLFESRCNEKGNSEYPEILKQIVKGSSPSSSNFSSFLFSVPKDVFNYANEITNNGRLKFLYIVFYAAKAYYLAKLMHMKGLSFPKNIIFSGTGSKSIQIIDNTPDLEILRNLFEFIFSKVYGEKASRIEIIPSEQPKEITCKGALADEESYDKVPVGFWMGGTRTEFDLILDIADDKIITYDDISKNSDLEEDIISSVELFYDIVDEYLRNNDMEDLFGVDYDVIKIFKENRSESLLEYLKMGLDKKVKESGTLDKPISESLFFYPLIGALNSLGVKLSKS